MEDNRAVEFACATEEFQRSGVIKQGAIAPFTADAHAVDLIGRFKEIRSIAFGGTGTIPLDKAPGKAVTDLDHIGQGHPGMGAIGAHIARVKGAVRRRDMFTRRQIPAQEPGKINAKGRHLRHQPFRADAIIVAMIV